MNKTVKVKRKILFFGKLPPPYIGPAVATQLILKSELKNHFNMIHFDLSHHRDIRDLGKFTLMNLLFPFKLYFKLVVDIIKYNPDMVYIPSQQTTIGYLRDIPFILISKMMGRKIVGHLRGGYFLTWYQKECGLLMKWIIRRIQSMIDGQIVLGHNLKILYSHIMPEEKIFVVPNGGNYKYPKKTLKNNDIIQILFLGNFIRTKGVIDLIQSVLLLPKKYYSRVQFVIAGHWREKDCEMDIRSLMKSNPDLPLRNVGPITGDEKHNVLINSDLFVFPTYYRNEGHPWVIVEAMAAGLPIISTDHGAIIESVIDGKNGFIVDKQCPEQIVEKIIYLIENPEKLKEMGVASRQLYLNKFTESSLVGNFKKAFDAVLS